MALPAPAAATASKPTDAPRFTCLKCSGSYTSGRVNWAIDWCKRCEEARIGGLTVSQLSTLFRRPGCQGCGAESADHSDCLACKNWSAEEQEQRDLASIPPGVLEFLGGAHPAGGAAPAPRAAPATSAYNSAALDHHHSLAENSARLKRATVSGSVTSAKGFRKGSLSTIGSAKARSGPSTLSVKPRQTPEFPTKLKVQWTTVLMAHGTKRPGSEDPSNVRSDFYPVDQMFQAVLDDGFEKALDFFISREFARVSDVGTGETHALALTEIRATWTRVKDDLTNQWPGLSLRRVLESLNEDPDAAKNILEKRKAQDYPIAESLAARMRITHTINVKQYNARIDKLEAEEAERLAELEENGDSAHESSDASPGASRKRSRDDESDVDDSHSSSDDGSDDFPRTTSSPRKRQDRLQGDRLTPEPGMEITGHDLIEVKTSVSRFSPPESTYDTSAWAINKATVVIRMPGTSNYYLSTDPPKTTKTSRIWTARSLAGRSLAFKQQHPRIATTEHNEYNANNKVFVIDQARNMARLRSIFYGFNERAIAQVISPPSLVLQVDPARFFERIDNAQPDIVIEGDETTMASRISVENEYFFATELVHGLTYQFNTGGVVDHELSPLTTLGKLVNALCHYALAFAGTAIKRLQGGFVGTTFLLFDVRFAEADRDAYEIPDISTFKGAHTCTSVCSDFGLDSFTSAEIKGKGPEA